MACSELSGVPYWTNLWGQEVSSQTPPTDDQLESARDQWSTVDWDAHVIATGGVAAGRARYDSKGGLNSYKNPNNDVIKFALFKLSKGRCWWQGGECRSRAVPPREAQIDHLVPKSATGVQLRNALQLGTQQKIFFDVHDPANLAYICGPCNLAKRDTFPITAAELDEVRRGNSRRNNVIKLVNKWYKDVDLDESGLSLKSMDISDDDVREIYADLIAEMIENLAAASDSSDTLSISGDVTVTSDSWEFHVRPSDDVIEAEIESRAEMEADDRRAELRCEEMPDDTANRSGRRSC